MYQKSCSILKAESIHLQPKQFSGESSLLVCLCVLFGPSVGKMAPTYRRGQSTLFGLPPQLLISPGNTQASIPKTLFSQISKHPVA